MRYTLVTALLLLFLLFVAQPAVADDFEIPQHDHGLEEDFDKLWSKYAFDEPSGGWEDASATEYLTHASDYFYLEPPEAPEEWNREEVSRFETDDDRSIHPEGTELEDGEIVKDAHVSFFAVEPSTIYPVPQPPEEEFGEVPDDIDAELPDDDTVLLAPARNAQVHGIVDYRIEEPNVGEVVDELDEVDEGDFPTGITDVEILDHEARVALSDGGQVVTVQDSSAGSFSLTYDEIPTGALKLTANVTVTVSVGDETITPSNVSVDDTLSVVPYDFSDEDSLPAVGTTGLYPDGDTALFLTPLVDPPGWSSVGLSDGTKIHSEWRFFSARDTDWDTVRESTIGGTEDAARGYHPVNVHAYPSRDGFRIDGDAEVEEGVGPRLGPPEMPDGVSVDTPDSDFNLSQVLDIRYNSSDESREITGLVRGEPAGIQVVPELTVIRETNLTLSVVERHDNGVVTVGVSLRDSEGNPIDTRIGDDYVRVEGREQVTTGLDGTTTVNVTPSPSGGVTARYVPEDWYDTQGDGSGYLPDTDTIYAETEYDLFEELGLLLQLGFFLLPFLILVFMFDRMLGLGVWPPWRRV